MNTNSKEWNGSYYGIGKQRGKLYLDSHPRDRNIIQIEMEYQGSRATKYHFTGKLKFSNKYYTQVHPLW